MMHRETLPISTLPAWERLTNVELTGIKISSTENGRGSGIYATTDLSKESTILMTVPRELVLSLETIWEYAKADHHLHDVLEAVGEFGRVRLKWIQVPSPANLQVIDSKRGDPDLPAHSDNVQCVRCANQDRKLQPVD